MLKAKTKETLFKFCVQVPRTDREAETFFFPGAIRWKAGGDLEWKQWVLSVDLGTFPKHTQSQFPGFQKREVGRLFYVCDYKFPGERRDVFATAVGRVQTPTPTPAPLLFVRKAFDSPTFAALNMV